MLPNLSSKASTSLGAPQPKLKIPIARCSFVYLACVIEDLNAKVIADFQSSPNQNRIVGISGIDGSGKSSLSSQLEQAVASNDIPVAVINLDALLQPRPIRHKQRDQIQGYFEDNFDYKNLFYKTIEPAVAKVIFGTHYLILDFYTDLITKRHLAFNGPDIIIVEGIFLFRRELRDWFHLKIWINISFETAMMRILKRSREQRYGDTNAIRARYEIRFFLAQRLFARDFDRQVASPLVIFSVW